MGNTNILLEFSVQDQIVEVDGAQKKQLIPINLTN